MFFFTDPSLIPNKIIIDRVSLHKLVTNAGIIVMLPEGFRRGSRLNIVNADEATGGFTDYVTGLYLMYL